MVPNELLEELRGTWGPSPNDPYQRAIWEESMELLAHVPQLLAELILRDGTSFDSLVDDLGCIQSLAELEAHCISRFFCSNQWC